VLVYNKNNDCTHCTHLKKKKKKNKISLKKGYTEYITQLVANLLINLSKIVPLGCFGKGYNGYNNALIETHLPYFKHNV